MNHVNQWQQTHISFGFGGTAGNNLVANLPQSPLLLLDRPALTTASEAESVGNGWQPASFWDKLRAFSSCCWNDWAPVDLEPFSALRDGFRLRSGSCKRTCSYTSSGGFDPGMTFVGQDEVLTGGRGWLGRTGRIPVDRLGQVAATEVWGFGARTFGLMHAEGGVVDIGTGDDFAWCAALQLLTGVDEDSVGDCTVVELSNMLTCDRSSAIQTAWVVLAGDTVDFDGNVWRLRQTGGDDNTDFPAKLEVEEPAVGWLLVVAATRVTIPSQMVANCACRTEACVAVGDEINRSWIRLTSIGKVFDLASTANKTHP